MAVLVLGNGAVFLLHTIQYIDKIGFFVLKTNSQTS